MVKYEVNADKEVSKDLEEFCCFFVRGFQSHAFVKKKTTLFERLSVNWKFLKIQDPAQIKRHKRKPVTMKACRELICQSTISSCHHTQTGATGWYMQKAGELSVNTMRPKIST